MTGAQEPSSKWDPWGGALDQSAARWSRRRERWDDEELRGGRPEGGAVGGRGRRGGRLGSDGGTGPPGRRAVEVVGFWSGARWRSGGSGAAHGEGRIDRGSGWRRAVGEGSVGRSGVTVGSMPVQCVVGGGLGRFVSG